MSFFACHPEGVTAPVPMAQRQWATGAERSPCYRAGVETTLADPRYRTPGSTAGGAVLHARWLGRVDYAEAHDLQKRLVEERAAGRIGDQLLLLEHPAVLTLGRQSDPRHIVATSTELASRGIDVVRVGWQPRDATATPAAGASRMRSSLGRSGRSGFESSAVSATTGSP